MILNSKSNRTIAIFFTFSRQIQQMISTFGCRVTCWLRFGQNGTVTLHYGQHTNKDLFMTNIVTGFQSQYYDKSGLVSKPFFRFVFIYLFLFFCLQILYFVPNFKITVLRLKRWKVRYQNVLVTIQSKQKTKLTIAKVRGICFINKIKNKQILKIPTQFYL